MGTGSDGKIYYVLCSAAARRGRTDVLLRSRHARQIKHLGDLTEACGEKDMKAVAQGKSHVQFRGMQGASSISPRTPASTPSSTTWRRWARRPPGWKPYQGGHFLSYDMATGKFERPGHRPGGEGIITMNMDTQRGRLYGLTWPTGHFLRYDLAKKEMKDLGPTSLRGRERQGRRRIARSADRSPSIPPTAPSTSAPATATSSATTTTATPSRRSRART